jgi:hypothetical protein
MVSVGGAGSCRGLLRIVSFWLGGCAALLSLSGCTADGTAICERLAECKLLPEGYSKGDCESELERERGLESCRTCVEEASCKDLLEECKDTCLLD